jgi:hypothetical protein
VASASGASRRSECTAQEGSSVLAARSGTVQGGWGMGGQTGNGARCSGGRGVIATVDSARGSAGLPSVHLLAVAIVLRLARAITGGSGRKRSRERALAGDRGGGRPRMCRLRLRGWGACGVDGCTSWALKPWEETPGRRWLSAAPRLYDEVGGADQRDAGVEGRDRRPAFRVWERVGATWWRRRSPGRRCVAWTAGADPSAIDNAGIIDGVRPTRADDPGEGRPAMWRGPPAQGVLAVRAGQRPVGWYRPGKGVLWVVELTLRAGLQPQTRKPPKRDRAEARSLRP